MPIPDYQSLMLPVLRIAGDRKEHSVADFRQRIASEMKLSEQELSERLASDSQTVFANRIGWAVQYLKAAVALKSVKHGVYQITDRGMAILKEKPSEITVKTLRRFPEFLEFHGKSTAPESAEVSAVPSSEIKATPEESLEQSYQTLREALATELLDTIKNGTPAAFEIFSRRRLRL
jgi:restriction system protein